MGNLNAILDAVPEQLAVLDGEFRHVYANGALARVFARSKDDIIGRTWRDLGLPEENIALAEADCRRAAQTGAPTRRTVVFAGRVYDFSVTAVTLEDGTPGYAIVSYDITEREHLLAELRASEERLRLSLSLGPIVAYTLDRDLRVTWISNNQIGATSDGSMLSKRRSEWFAPRDAERLDALSRQVMETGMPLRTQMLLRGRDRSESQWFDITMSPLWESGAVVGLTGAGVDITDIRRTTALVAELVMARDAADRAKQEAEAAAASKSAFFAAASHDLRQPFQALRLYAELLKGGAADTRTRDIAKLVEQALDAGEHILHLLREMSLLETGLVKPQLATFSIGDALEAMQDEFAVPAADAGVRLSVVRSSLRVVSDRVLVERILRKLLRNAVRFAAGGKVLMGTRRRGSSVVVEVWDNGPGIPDEAQRLVFEPFYQFGNAERDRRQGLGMGLPLASAFAQTLGTRLELRSRPGRGCCFFFALPLHVAPPTCIELEGDMQL